MAGGRWKAAAAVGVAGLCEEEEDRGGQLEVARDESAVCWLRSVRSRESSGELRCAAGPGITGGARRADSGAACAEGDGEGLWGRAAALCAAVGT